MPAATLVRGDKSQTGATHVLMLPDGFSYSDTNASNDPQKGAFPKLCDEIADSLEKAGWLKAGSKLCLWRGRTHVNSKHPLVQSYCANFQPPGLPPTRFGTRYLDFGGECKVLLGNSWMVLEEANKLTGPPNFTRWNMILVVVNSDHYGGYCSGDIAWTYKSAADAGLMAQHELAHVFGLFDEYENLCNENDPANSDALEELNISSNPAAPRWKKTDETMQLYPKSTTDHCLGADGGDNGSIGSFQGGNHTHLAYYRPAFRCRMRELEDAFCEVCKKHLETSLYPVATQTG